MLKSKPTDKKELSGKKRVIFTLLLVLTPVFFFLLLEFSLRIVHYGHDFSLFVNHPDPACAEYKIINPDYGAKYFQKLEYSSPKNDLFLKKKDKNTVRIIVMGSSTVAGFPYDANLMFPRILQTRLQEAYPGKRIEVINTAIAAVNSFTLLDITNDILAEEPDAIIFYEGHNEYYGAFGVGSNEGIGQNRSLKLLHLKLMNLRVYQWVNHLVGAISKSATVQDKKEGTLMGRIVKKANIEYQSADYKLGLEQFRENLSSILKKAADKKVPVYIGTLVSNISDMKPFGSVASPSGESADDAFQNANEAKKQGNYALAKELYTKARDLDCVRFRASSEINKAIEELAGKYNAFLVPTLQVFEKNSPNSLVGTNLILEHLHPNVSGYFLMADAFYSSITRSGLMKEEPNRAAEVSPASFQRNYGYTALDSLLGIRMTESLECHWPFRKETDEDVNFRWSYKPVNLVDSMVYSITVNKSITPEYAHLVLAKKYLAKNDLYNAFREYNAIVTISPSTPEMLNEAANFYLSAGYLELALKYFTRSAEFEKSYSGYFKAGEVNMIRNDYEKAVENFNKALGKAGNDSKAEILTKLYQSYRYWGKNSEADHTQQEMRKFKPDVQIPLPPKRYSFGQFIPFQIRDNVEKSYALFGQGKTEDALGLLFASLKTIDSPDVNRMIGMIYLQKQDFGSAREYLNKAYSWFKYEPQFVGLMFQINLNSKNFAAASNCLEQLKTIDPNNQNIAALGTLLQNAKQQ